MFTEGQKTRMIDALNSTNGYRNNLWSVNNLVFTGCSNTTDIVTIISVTNKKLIRVIDVLGRKTKGTKNKPLFYIYDDGTVEKKIIID